MKSTYIIYYEAYGDNLDLKGCGNIEVTELNAGQGFLDKFSDKILTDVKTKNKDVLDIVIKHICKL